MPEPIVIRVVNKLPVRVSGEPVVVCDNSDYTVVWQLDEEWSGTVTMRAVFADGSYQDVILTDNAGMLPAVPEPGAVLLGLYAGDIRTTRPVKLLGVRSILTDGGRPYEPSEDVYAQLVKKLDEKLDSNLGAENVGKLLAVDADGNVVPKSGTTGGASSWDDLTGKPFDTLGSGLKVTGRALEVDTADEVEQDNTRPITAAAVYRDIGNINALLATI